jgi:hypothetical protein
MSLCCVLSGRGLCDQLITRPEESYRLWCVVVCDLENLVNEEAMTHWGLLRQIKKVVWLEKSAVQNLIHLHSGLVQVAQSV